MEKRVTNGPYSIGDFLCYMDRYLNDAKARNNPIDHAECLAAIRKLTAVGGAAIEKFGGGTPR